MLRPLFAARPLRPSAGGGLASCAGSGSGSGEWAGARPYAEVPGPRPLPLLGNAWRFLPGGDLHGLDALQMQRRLLANHGPLVRLRALPGRPDLLYAFRPQDAERVFRNEGRYPERDGLPCLYHYRAVTRRDRYRDVGAGLVAQGEEWRRYRSKMNPVLMRPRALDRYVEPVNQVADEFVDRMHALRDSDRELPADFKNELHKWALESVAAVGLDARLGCFAPGLPADSEPQRVVNATLRVFDSMAQFLVKPYLWRFVSTPVWRRFVRDMDLITDVAWKYAEAAKQRLQASAGGGEGEPSILEELLRRESASMAAALALDLILGGTDTTAQAMASLLAQLSELPELQRRLAAELRAELGPGPRPAVPAAALPRLRLLRATIRESMRLAPLAPSNLRRLPCDLVLSGYRVPAGTDVVLCQLAMSRQEEHVPQADRFLPERWLQPAGPPHPFASLPFGFGPRMCIGRRLAELELTVLAAKILHRYRVDYLHGPMRWAQPAFYAPSDPLRFRITEWAAAG